MIIPNIYRAKPEKIIKQHRTYHTDGYITYNNIPFWTIVPAHIYIYAKTYVNPQEDIIQKSWKTDKITI